MLYKLFIRPLFFRFDPEKIHSIICVILKIPIITKVLDYFFAFHHPLLENNVCGLKFKNPIGLAAGFDKDAELIEPLSSLGFGFIEIGTVTPKAQSGNEKPRLFRLPKDEALVNRMGFNNAGVEYVRKNLLKYKGNSIVGGNIGKNKNTANEDAVKDYAICFNRLHDVVDYFVVNVSSPNTPGLRELQDKQALAEILGHLQILNRSLKEPKPIFLKIAPDLTDHQLDDIIQVVMETKTQGIIATNTTIGRESLHTAEDQIVKIGSGGLSGKPLSNRSTEIIRTIAEKSKHAFPIIGVGGIHSPEDALEKIMAGASLIQLYTGFIYEGPGIVKRINKKLLATGIYHV